MNKKISMCAICCAVIMTLASGCANYDDVTLALDDVTIKNTLPKVSENASYRYLDDIDDLVYEQQLNACTMYADAYNETYYQQFDDGKRKKDKTAYLCTEKRKEINTDIEIAYAINIYRLLQDVTDCTNPDAYVVKTHKDVLDFYDIYYEYENGDDPQKTLVNILTEYYERSNILAFNFLKENEIKVYKAALAKIEDNASQDEELRVNVNENNNIITALNEVYGSIPNEYADKISELNTELAKKLLMSLESIDEEERIKLLAQLEPATPSPSPTMIPTSTPVTATHGPMPTPIPVTPRPTATPSRTKAPVSTNPPEATVRVIPTTAPTAAPTQAPTHAPTEEPYEPIFGIDNGDTNEGNNNEDDGIFTFN